MASKINKWYGADIKGVLNTNNGIVSVEVEDMPAPVIFSDFIEDFVDKDVKNTIAYNEEL